MTTKTTTLETGKRLKKLPLDLINLVGADDGADSTHDLYDERVHMPLSAVHMAIIEDMKENGFDPAHPIEVRKNKETGKYDVVTGRQRTRCARAAELVEVQCLVVTTKGGAAISKLIMENELRSQDDVLVRGRKVRRLMDADPSLTQKDIATKLGVDPGTVKNILRVADDGVEQLHDAITQGLVTDAVAYYIAGLGEDTQAEVLEQLIAYDLSPKQAMDFVKDVKKEEQSGTHDPVEKVAKKLPDLDFYSKLGKADAEHFMALTADLDTPEGAAFREGIRFVFEQKTVADEDNVPGLKAAFGEFMKMKRKKQREKQAKLDAKANGEEG